MTKPIYIIYKITHIPSNNSYIGQTCYGFKKRWVQHVSDAKCGSKCVIHCSIRKHGKDNFSYEILFETTDQNIINEKEIEFIAKYDTYKNGYNSTIGGEATFGYKHTNKAKLKMSIIHKDKKKGKNNPLYNGNYHTPYGIFESSKQAVTNKISDMTIRNWCKKHPNKTITNKSISHSLYLQSLTESPEGKTFKEIGFWFEPILSLKYDQYPLQGIQYQYLYLQYPHGNYHIHIQDHSIVHASHHEF